MPLTPEDKAREIIDSLLAKEIEKALETNLNRAERLR